MNDTYYLWLNCLGPSRQEAKNDVWKYLQTVVMGLYTVSLLFLDNQGCAHSPISVYVHMYVLVCTLVSWQAVRIYQLPNRCIIL